MAPILVEKMELMIAEAIRLGYTRAEVLQRAKNAVLRLEAQTQAAVIKVAQTVAQ